MSFVKPVSILVHDKLLYFALPIPSKAEHLIYVHSNLPFIEQSTFVPSFHQLLSLSSFMYDPEGNEIKVDVHNKMHLSMMEGMIRHMFKLSKTRVLYCPPNILKIVKLLIKANKFEYTKFFTFTGSKQEAWDYYNVVVSRIPKYAMKSKKFLSFVKLKNYQPSARLTYYKEHQHQIKIVQRCIRTWLVKLRLKKEIGPNKWRILERVRRFRLKFDSDRKCEDRGIIIRKSPFNDTPPSRVDFVPTKVDKDKLWLLWERFMENQPYNLESNFENRIYRTIINHAKWCYDILNQDLYWTICGSSFMILARNPGTNVFEEVHGFFLRSLYRRLIANRYETHVDDVPWSSRPVKPYGGLFYNIVRGLRTNKLDLLEKKPKDQIDGEDLKKLFWIKFGKRSRSGNTVMRHVMWVRKGVDYVFKIKHSDRDFRPRTSSTIDEFRIDDIDHDFNIWLRDMYAKCLIDQINH